MKTKIAILFPYLWNGGAERVATDLMQHLSRDFEVHLIVFSTAHVADVAVDRIRVIESGGGVLISKALSFIGRLRRLHTLFKKEKYAAVISIMERSNITNTMLHWVNKEYQPILSIHCVPSFFRKRGLKKYALIHIFHKYLIPKDIPIIAVSRGIKCEMERIYKFRNVNVINNPIDTAKIDALASQNPGISQQNYIVHVGRLERQKRQDLLIRAFANILPDNPRLNLMFIGQGPKRAAYAKLVTELNLQDRVVFMGQMENPYPYIASSLFLCLTSESEGCGLVLLEAMYLRKLVISTNCPYGPPEIIGGNDHISEDPGLKKFGILIPHSNGSSTNDSDLIAHLTNTIQNVLANPETRVHYETVGRQRARDYCAETICEQYAELIKQVCRNVNTADVSARANAENA